MSSRGSRRHPAAVLAEAADAYQRAVVIPHCSRCTQPCCRLDPLVLELAWFQLKGLWQIEESRRAFDRRLCSGRGPAEIRAADGLYFAHGKVCPAYDEAGRSCRVYGQDLKPAGCSDFPVYEDGGAVVADLRCEAVDLATLASRVANALGPGHRVVPSPDPDFPFLVTLMVKRVTSKGATE
jgi:Fe-S-cluster containining protein